MTEKDFTYDSIEVVCSDLKIVFITDEQMAATGITDVHMHSFWEVFCLLEGELIVHGEMESFALSAGDFLIVPPNVYHSSSSGEGVVKRSAFFTFEKVKRKEEDEPLFSKVCAAISGQFHYLSKDGYAEYLFSRILSGCASEGIGQKYRVRAAVAELIFHFSDVIKAGRTQGGEIDVMQSSYWVYKYAIDRLLDIYYMTDISLSDLSNKLFTSPKNVARIISTAYGKSFNDLKLELKMRNAKKFLRETDLSVSAIAARTGYTTSRGFLAAFSKYEGMTPAEYRKRIREKQ